VLNTESRALHLETLSTIYEQLTCVQCGVIGLNKLREGRTCELNRLKLYVLMYEQVKFSRLEMSSFWDKLLN
jgi:uncharacterized protein YfkK (UPF0435 family)